MATLVNKPFTMEITKTGRIKSVDHVDNLYKGMFDAFPQIPEAKKAQVKAQLEQSYGAKAFKNNLEQVFAFFPDVKVAKDDKWVVNTKLESLVSAGIKTTYVLKDITDKTYVIHGEAAMEAGNVKDYQESHGMMMRYTNLTGTSQADLTVDRETGWIIQTRETKNIKVTAEIKDSPQMPGGTAIPMVLNISMITADK